MKQLAADNLTALISERLKGLHERWQLSVVAPDRLTPLLATLPIETQQIVLDMLTELFYIEDESDRKAWYESVYVYIASKLTADKLRDFNQQQCSQEVANLKVQSLWMAAFAPMGIGLESPRISIYFDDNLTCSRTSVNKRTEAQHASGRIWTGNFCKSITVSFFKQEVTKRASIWIRRPYEVESYVLFIGTNLVLASGHWTNPDHVILEVDDGCLLQADEQEHNDSSCYGSSACTAKEGDVIGEKPKLCPDAVAYKVPAREHGRLTA